MTTRTITVELGEDTAPYFDAALTGNDDDLLLAVEKAIVGRLFPGNIITGGLGRPDVITEPDEVNVTDVEGVENKPIVPRFDDRCGCGAVKFNECCAAVEGYYTSLSQRSDEQLNSMSKDDGCMAARVLLISREQREQASA